MTKKRRQHSAQYKFQIALEAARREKTVSQIASEHNIHPNQVSQWKRQLLDSGAEVFSRQQADQERELEQREAELYEQIGRLRIELEWLKKRWPLSVEMKRTMAEPQHPELSIRRQCELLGLSRASYYAQPAGGSSLHLELMRRIDEQFLATPFYGVPQMTACLRRAGYCVNPKRIRRLMRLMGLEAVYPRPRTSVAAPEHKIHPYLLRGLSITQPDQVWCADITYVPMTKGYMYLTEYDECRQQQASQFIKQAAPDQKCDQNRANITEY